MRIFTKEEKEILKRINIGLSKNLLSIIDPWITGVSFQVDTSNNSVVFIFENVSGLVLNERLLIIQSIVIQSVNLIKLFEDKGYIFTFQNANQLPANPFIFGQFSTGTTTITHQFTDKKIAQMFCDYSFKEIFVTPELNKFIEDGFNSREEVRANRQWKTTIVAISVAIIALFFNICVNFRRDNVSMTNPKFLENTRSKFNCPYKLIEKDTLILIQKK